MPSFGERLKLERVKRAITLEQISSSTKIGTRMLQALEEENFDQLPGGIFNKGFVRAYARHLGLDEDQAITDYLEASGQNSPPPPGPEFKPPFDPKETSPSYFPRKIPWNWLAAGLLVVALALFLWSRWKHGKEAHNESAAPIAISNAASPPLAEAISRTKETAAAKPANPLPKPASNGLLLTTSSPPAAGEFTVVVLGHEDCWLSIQADDNPIVEEMLAAESQRAIHGRKQVVIKAGNTGGIDFVFNGKKLPPQGDYGEVKTLTFGPSGLQANAPPPVATP